MSLNLILIAIQVVVFFSFLSYVYKKHGILDAISDSYYKLKRKNLFVLFCWGIGIPMIFITPYVLFFLAGSGMVFLGAAARYKDRITATVHIIGAISGIVLALMGLWVHYGMWWPLVVMIVLYLLLRLLKLKNFTWWIESLAFVVIVGSLILLML